MQGPLGRSGFSAVVEALHVTPLELRWEPQAESKVRDLVESAGVLIVGELHGTHENARLIAHLVGHFGFRAIALEWPTWWAVALDAWLDGRGLPFSMVASERPDGRVTAGHFSVLRQLRTDGQLDRLILIDGHGRGRGFWNARDSAMANNFLAQRDPAGACLVVVGRAHTPSEPMRGRNPVTGGSPGDGVLFPFSYHIKQAVPDILIAGTSFRSGTFWNMEKRELPGKPLDDRGRVSLGRRGLEITAHSASLPAVPLAEPPTHPDLRTELIERKDREQHLRFDLIEWQKQNRNASQEVVQECWRPIAEVDSDNTAWLRRQLHEVAWPAFSVVGPDGENAAFLIVQHSPDRDFQKRALELLKAAVDAGEASPSGMALLTDRVRVFDGQPQLYGSQGAYQPDGSIGAGEIEDRENVDERRRRVGLEPLDDYIKGLNRVYIGSAAP